MARPSRPYRLSLAPLVGLALLALAGCGEAAWNPHLKLEGALDKGTPFVEALAAHGCPDSIHAIDSDTFTATWERVRIVAFAPFYAHRDRVTLGYLVRKGKISGTSPIKASVSGGLGLGFGADETGPLRSTGSSVGLIPFLAVVLAWQLGRAFRERLRFVLSPLLVTSVLLLATTWASDRTGVTAPGGGVTEGSLVGVLYDELGDPDGMIHLPGDSGTLFVYRAGEKKHAIVGGSEAASAQAFLVQRGKVVRPGPKTTTLQAQYYLFPFFATGEARLHSVIAWSVGFATLALLFTTRRRKTPPVEPAAPAAPAA